MNKTGPETTRSLVLLNDVIAQLKGKQRFAANDLRVTSPRGDYELVHTL